MVVHGVRVLRILSLGMLLVFFALFAGTAVAQSGGKTGAEPSTDDPHPSGITPVHVAIKVGRVTEASPNTLSGADRAGLMASASTQCHRQKVIMQYTDANNRPFINFTGIKEWCFDGQQVTSGTMQVETWVRPDLRYGSDQDGYVYVPSALKKTDQFLTYKGHFHGAHRSTRLGRFEYRVHGLGRPAQVFMPFVSRTGHYDGTCAGPMPTDLAPKVTTVRPAAGARSVPTTANIVATFSTDMKASTIGPATFYLIKESSGEQLQAMYRYDAASKTATLDPKSKLLPGATYTATVFAGPYGVLSTNGDPITQQKVWSFTVAK